MKTNTLFFFFYHMSLLSSQNEKCVRQILRKSKHSFYVQVFAPNRAVCKVMWENMVESDGPQMTVRHNMAHAHSMLDT